MLNLSKIRVWNASCFSTVFHRIMQQCNILIVVQLLKVILIVKGDLGKGHFSRMLSLWLNKNDLKLKLCSCVLTLISINDKTQYLKHTRYVNWKESLACVVSNPTHTICNRFRKFRIRRHVCYWRMVTQKSIPAGRHGRSAAVEFVHPAPALAAPQRQPGRSSGDLSGLTFCRALQQRRWWPPVIKGQQTLAWSNCSMNFGTFWVGSCWFVAFGPYLAV